MKRTLKSRKCRKGTPESGYVLLTLILALALVTVGMLAMIPKIDQQIQRDREEELRHRGTEYMRAIQHYYKKLGRYPLTIEDLENTNNICFLRKRYKDPMSRDPKTGQERDFKLIRQTDLALSNQMKMPGMTAPILQGEIHSAEELQRAEEGEAQTGAADQNDEASASAAAKSDAEANTKSAKSTAPNSTASEDASAGVLGPPIGGGAILGVASTSKAKSIHVFFNKNHYNDWLFIYIDGIDKMGGVLTGPVNPGLPKANFESVKTE